MPLLSVAAFAAALGLVVFAPKSFLGIREKLVLPLRSVVPGRFYVVMIGFGLFYSSLLVLAWLMISGSFEHAGEICR